MLRPRRSSALKMVAAGAFILAEACIPFMPALRSSIINISSIRGMFAEPNTEVMIGKMEEYLACMMRQPNLHSYLLSKCYQFYSKISGCSMHLIFLV